MLLSVGGIKKSPTDLDWPMGLEGWEYVIMNRKTPPPYEKAG